MWLLVESLRNLVPGWRASMVKRTNAVGEEVISVGDESPQLEVWDCSSSDVVA